MSAEWIAQSPIGRDENKKELIAMRFNLRIPFTTSWLSSSKEAPEDFVTTFGTPEIQIQKRIREGRVTGEWEKFGAWKDFLKPYVELSEVDLWQKYGDGRELGAGVVDV